ncbi:MAG TPA: translation initiation factor IF-3 [Bacteroidetes bacterium]|nr:translation initiation factor IF-3 [Bacteroidota bacterium]
MKTRINEQIRVPEVRVIDENGDQAGVKPTQEALRMARSKDLDLIEVSPNAKPPVCKIGDFGKYNYEKQKKEKEQKKSKTSTQLKEIRFHPNTDTHDMDFKCRHLVEFLVQGHKVKATIIFIGRMMVHQDIGRKLMDEILERLTVVGKIEQPPKMEGRYLTVMLIPDKKKIDDYKKNLEKGKPSEKTEEAKVEPKTESKPEPAAEVPADK